MLRLMHVLALVCLCGLFLLVPDAEATSYVFGKDGVLTKLTASGAGATWTSSDSFIVAGDCYVDDDDTLTICEGVTVVFAGNRSAPTAIPEIDVKGTIISNGSSTNPVVFTNESGTTKGLFEGLYLNGDSTGTSSDYEGRLEGKYTHFLYGGYSTGVVRVGKNGTLDMDNSIFRHSDKHEIYIQDSGGEVVLDTCSIDSCDIDGIHCTNGENDDAVINTCYTLFSYFGRHGIHGGNCPPDRDDPNIIPRNNIFEYPGDREEPDAGIYASDHEWYDIKRCIFFDLDYGIWFDDTYYGEPDSNIVKNSAFLYNSWGILWSDLDNTVDGVSQKTCLLNNTFIDCDRAIEFDGYNGNNWPDDNLKMERNLFAGGNTRDISNAVNPGQDKPDIPATNAVPTDGNNLFNIDVGDAIVEDEDGEWKLVDEVRNFRGRDAYNLHIRFTPDSPIINVDGDFTDADGSDADIGCYGGEFGIGEAGVGWGMPGDHINVSWGDNPFISSFHIGLCDSDLVDGGVTTIEATTYKIYEDWFEIESDDTLIIEAGTYIAIGGSDQADITVEGKLVADGTGSTIYFGDGCDNGRDDFVGLMFLSGADPTSIIDHVEFINIGTFAAICVDNMQNSTSFLISNTDIEGANRGIYISDDSAVEIESCEIHECGTGIKIEDLTTPGDVGINNTYVHDNTGVGIYLDDSEPVFDEQQEYETKIDENGSYGIHALNSSFNLSDEGDSQVRHNEDSEIFLSGDSTPLIEYNDIEPNGGQDPYAIEWNTNGANACSSYVIGKNVWWGTQNPGDGLFSLPDSIDYSSNLDDDLVDDYNLYIHAIECYFEDDYEHAIPLFERCILNEDDRRERRRTAIDYLLGCYDRTNGDLNDLRNFLNRVAMEAEDRDVANWAKTKTIYSLILEGRYEDMIGGFIGRRDEFDNPVDSLRNEIRILKAQWLLNGNRRIPENDSWMCREDFTENIQDLERQIRETWNTEKINTDLIPQAIQLTRIYPNPFNNLTRVYYDLTERMNVEVSVFNSLGKEVTILDNSTQEAGSHYVSWNASNIASGIYFIKLKTPIIIQTSKVVLMR